MTTFFKFSKTFKFIFFPLSASYLYYKYTHIEKRKFVSLTAVSIDSEYDPSSQPPEVSPLHLNDEKLNESRRECGKFETNGDLTQADECYHSILADIFQAHANKVFTYDEYLTRTTHVFSFLGNLALKDKRLKESEQIYRQIIANLLHLGYDEKSNAFIEASLKLATVFVKSNRSKEAESGFKYCITTLVNKLNQFPEHSNLDWVDETTNYDAEPENYTNTLAFLGITLDSYARFLIIANRQIEAIHLLREALSISKKLFFNKFDKYQEIIRIQNDLAKVLAETGSVAEASTLMDDCTNMMENYYKNVKNLELQSNLVVYKCNHGQVLKMAGEREKCRVVCRSALKLAQELKRRDLITSANSCLRQC